MLKFFYRLGRLADDANSPDDLLSHPDIARMDARELGDLPFPRPATTTEKAECPTGSPVQAKASVTLISPTNRPFQLCMA
jgi:hypothetical protein